MSDLSPMLHQEPDYSPQLGGDRRSVACGKCGGMCVRDLLGHPVCPECTFQLQALADLQERPECPRCGNTESIWCELYPGDKIVHVFCYECALQIYIAKDYQWGEVVATAFMVDGGKFDEWEPC